MWHVCMYVCMCDVWVMDTLSLTDDPKKTIDIKAEGTHIAFGNTGKKQTNTPLSLALKPSFYRFTKKLKEQKSLYSVSPNFILQSDHQFYLFFSIWVGFGGWIGFASLLNLNIITFMESF